MIFVTVDQFTGVPTDRFVRAFVHHSKYVGNPFDVRL